MSTSLFRGAADQYCSVVYAHTSILRAHPDIPSPLRSNEVWGLELRVMGFGMSGVSRLKIRD